MIKTKKYLPLLILTCLLFGQDQSVPWPVIKKTKVYKNPTEKRIKIAFKSIKKGEVIKIYNVKNNSYIKINYKGNDGWVLYDELNISDEAKDRI